MVCCDRSVISADLAVFGDWLVAWFFVVIVLEFAWFGVYLWCFGPCAGFY